MKKTEVEPWLRGGHTEVKAVPRAVLHAIELADEDLEKWCVSLTDTEFETRPLGLPSVGFQLRHIARSLDRLLIYAEGGRLDASQIQKLKSELEAGCRAEALRQELKNSFAEAGPRILQICERANLEEIRVVGRENLPSTVGGLLIHIAEHTQRHVGQAITTAKVIIGQRAEKRGG